LALRRKHRAAKTLSLRFGQPEVAAMMVGPPKRTELWPPQL
jgi:hypothetical protein